MLKTRARLLRGGQLDRGVRPPPQLRAGVLQVQRDRVETEGLDRHVLRDHSRPHKLHG